MSFNNPDPLSFLDEESIEVNDSLSFLDEKDPLSFLDTLEEPKKETILDRAKSYFTSDRFGEALLMGQQSGGFSGAPALSPQQAAQVGTEVGTIAATEALFAPIVGAAAASKFAPKVLSSIARIAQAGTTGVATATTGKLVESGELPTKEEIAKQGLQWAAIDGVLQAFTHLSSPFFKSLKKSTEPIQPTRLDKLRKLAKESPNPNEREAARRAIKRLEDKKPSLLDNAAKIWNNFKKKLRDKFNWSEQKINELEFSDKKNLTQMEQETLIAEANKVAKEEEKAANKIIDSVEKPITKDVKKAEVKKEKPISIPPKVKPVSPQDQETINRLESIAKAGDPLDKAQANWVLDEIKSTGNSLDEVMENFPTMWEEKDGKYFPEKVEMEPPEKISPPKNGKVKPKSISELKPKEKGIYRVETINREGKPIFARAEFDGKKWDDNAPKKIKNYEKIGETWDDIDINKDISQTPIKKSELKPKEKPKIKTKTEKVKPLAAKGEKKTPPSTKPRRPVIGTKQAAKRSDIIKLFRKAFNDPIRLGKFKQRAAGIHKVWPRVTRLLKDNDVETAAHEIGHNLHTVLYGGDAKTDKQQVINVTKALQPYMDELYELAPYKPYALEGFAEFTRLYVTNPDVAKALAPKFYTKFEADLTSQYPELKNALLEARDYYDRYLEGTPESRVKAQVSFDSGQEKADLTNITEWVKAGGVIDKLKTYLLDDVFPAKRLVAEAFGIPIKDVENLKDPRNLYRSLRLLKGAVGKADVYLMHETFDADTLEKTGESLRSILNGLPDDQSYEDFNLYLVARRAIEKSGQGIDTGINPGDALYVEEKFRPQYGELAKRLDKYNDALLKYLLDSDVISKESYDLIKKNNLLFTPFQRDLGKKSTALRVSSSIQGSNPIKRMRGSTKDILPPIESIIKNTYSLIMNAEKNRVGKILAELSKMKGVGPYVERVPTPTKLKAKISRDEIEKATIKHLKDTGQFDLLDLEDGKIGLREDIKEVLPDLITKFGATTYPAGENIITVYDKGKPTYYEVSPDLYQMWKHGTSPYMANHLVKILRQPARLLRAGAILSPKFIQKNPVRDTWERVLFTRYGKSLKNPVNTFLDILYEPLSHLAIAARKGPLYVEWMKAGGGMATLQSMDRNKIVKQLNEIRGKHNPADVIGMLRKISELTEEANRLVEFGRGLEVNEKTRIGKEIAAYASRDISIDYAKMGLLVKALNQIIPFFNASIQGVDKLARTLGDKDARKQFLLRGAAYIVLPSLILAWLNKDDEDIKELQDQERDFNFLFKIGKRINKIPVPFEAGIILHGLTQRMFNYFMTKDPEAFEGFMGSILEAGTPNIIPQFALPAIEAEANKNFFTGGRIIPDSKEKLISKLQYTNYTSTTAKLIGRAINYMVPDTRTKYAAPAVIDHFINSWTGGLGRTVINILDTALEAVGLGDKIPKPYQTVTEKFGLDAFKVRFPRANTKSIEKFYDNYQDAMSRKASYKYAQKQEVESPEEIEKGYKRIEKIYDLSTLDRAYNAIQNCQRAINEIMLAPDIEPKAKREMVEELYKQMIEFAKNANEDIKRYRLDQKKK